MTKPVTYTHPDVLTIGVRDGWADAETDPTQIAWPERQARAAIPFEVIDGRPVNPCGPTGIRYGRNELGHWGEQLAADALVFVTDPAGRRWVLLIERDDGHGWAIPGGMVDPDETAPHAAIRELAEETGLTVPEVSWTATPPRYVPDPRASDESWMVTVLCVADLGEIARDDFPDVTGAEAGVIIERDQVRMPATFAGWRPNQCRRQPCGETCQHCPGIGHTWMVWVVPVERHPWLSLSPREVSGATWAGPDEITELISRTVAYVGREISRDEWRDDPGLEPVWVRWLLRTGVADVPTSVLAVIERNLNR